MNDEALAQKDQASVSNPPALLRFRCEARAKADPLRHTTPWSSYLRNSLHPCPAKSNSCHFLSFHFCPGTTPLRRVTRPSCSPGRPRPASPAKIKVDRPALRSATLTPCSANLKANSPLPAERSVQSVLQKAISC